jgi:hypothetical protein
VLQVQQELKELRDRTSKSEEGWAEKEQQLASQHQLLEERVGDLTRQNDVLHEEAEKVGVGVTELNLLPISMQHCSMANHFSKMLGYLGQPTDMT